MSSMAYLWSVLPVYILNMHAMHAVSYAFYVNLYKG